MTFDDLTANEALDFQRYEEMVANITSMRRELLGRFLDPRRNIDAECGFKSSLSPREYQDLYENDPFAKRAVEVIPKECWKVTPLVYEKADAKSRTAFDKSFDALCKSLRGERSWYKGDKGNPFWEYCYRAHVQARIGTHGVMYVGVDDGLSPNLPAKGVQEMNSMPDAPGKDTPESTGVYNLTVNAQETAGRKLVQMRVFPAVYAEIVQFEYNRTSPRYGKPVMYKLTHNYPSNDMSGTLPPNSTELVHWTRIVHVPGDRLGTSEMFSDPILKPLRRNIQSLQKVCFGSGEMYWRGAFPGISLESNPQLGAKANIDRTKVRNSMEQYQNGLQRYLLLIGMTAKTLAPTVVDPTPFMDPHTEAMAIALGIPIPVLKGYEIGEQASKNNDKAHADRMAETQNDFLTPMYIVPLIDRLIMLGCLAPPTETYCVEWPDLTQMSAQEKATVLAAKTGAYNVYASGSMPTVVPPLEYMTKFDDMDEETAQAILDEAEQQQQDQEDADIAKGQPASDGPDANNPDPNAAGEAA